MNQTSQRLKYILGDLLATAAGWTAFYVYRFDVTGYMTYPSLEAFLSAETVRMSLITAPMLWMALYAMSGYYRNPFFKSHLEELQTTAMTVLVGTMVCFFSMVIDDVPWIDDSKISEIKVVHVEPRVYLEIVLTMYCCIALPVFFSRYFITHMANSRISRGVLGLRTLMVGHGKAAQQLLNELESRRRKSGFIIVGCIDSGYDKNSRNLGIPHLGTFDEVKSIVTDHDIEAFMLAPDLKEPRVTYRLIYELLPFGLPIRMRAGNEEIQNGQVRTESLTQLPMLEFGPSHLSAYQRSMKRIGDIGFALTAMVVLLPVYLVLALMVKCDSKGPVLFRQERIGRCGRPFGMYKFRTMREDAETEGPQLTQDNDPRITRIGHTLRKYRLDELPQFWNILRGDMSLVGPRPERDHYIRQIIEIAPSYSKLLQIRPGLTSSGMVQYGYASNVFQMVERMRYDLIYIDNCNLIVDIKIMAYTIRTVFTGKGI